MEEDIFGYENNEPIEIERKNIFYTEEEMKSFRNYELHRKNALTFENNLPSLDKTISHDGNDFVFPNLYVGDGDYKTIRFLGSPLDNGSRKSFASWFTSTANNGQTTIMNTIIFYQMLYRAYINRDNVALKEPVEKFKNLIYNIMLGSYQFNRIPPYLGTYIKYGLDLEATIYHLNTSGKISKKPITIPEFTRLDNIWSYLTLAQKQPKDCLGLIEPIPKNSVPLLETLFGENYEDAGTVFQYIYLINNLLPNVRIFVPPRESRKSTEAVSFSINWPELSINMRIQTKEERPAYGIIVE